MSFLQDDTMISVKQLYLGVPLVLFIGIMILLYREKYIRSANSSTETEKEQNWPHRPHTQAETCCICCSEMAKEVRVTCGHSFCGKCLIEYWKFKLQSKLECPLCRKNINDITCHFLTSKDIEMKGIIREVKRYNMHYSDQSKKLNEILQDLPYFMKQMMSSFLENLPYYMINLFFCSVLLSMFYFGI